MKKLSKGFSLIEMLIVMMIFSILAVLATSSLATSLNGTRKSESLGHVRENIEYAMSIMERSLRAAKDLDCDASSSTRIVYKTANNIEASFEIVDCFIPPNDRGNIASASGGISRNLVIEDDVMVVCGLLNSRFTCNQGISGKPDSVTIRITAEDIEAQGAGAVSYSSETQILLRNY